MGVLSDLLSLASQRAHDLNLPYQGALTPMEAYQVWQLAPGACLVDIRTRAEWEWVGRVPEAIEIEWLTWPEGLLNSNFIAQLHRSVNPQSLVLFLCRSGGRSDHAARVAAQAGYSNCYNVLEGFEGVLDINRQRGHIGGWRHAGLPWYQG